MLRTDDSVVLGKHKQIDIMQDVTFRECIMNDSQLLHPILAQILLDFSHFFVLVTAKYQTPNANQSR